MQFSALMVPLPSWARRPEIIRSHDDLHINRRLLNIFQAEPHKAQGCTTSSRSISTSAVSDFCPPLSYPSLGSVFPERRETFRKLHKFGLQPGRLQASRLNTVDQKTASICCTSSPARTRTMGLAQPNRSGGPGSPIRLLLSGPAVGSRPSRVAHRNVAANVPRDRFLQGRANQ